LNEKNVFESILPKFMILVYFFNSIQNYQSYNYK